MTLGDKEKRVKELLGIFEDELSMDFLEEQVHDQKENEAIDICDGGKEAILDYLIAANEKDLAKNSPVVVTFDEKKKTLTAVRDDIIIGQVTDVEKC